MNFIHKEDGTIQWPNGNLEGKWKARVSTANQIGIVATGRNFNVQPKFYTPYILYKILDYAIPREERDDPLTVKIFYSGVENKPSRIEIGSEKINDVSRILRALVDIDDTYTKRTRGIESTQSLLQNGDINQLLKQDLYSLKSAQ